MIYLTEQELQELMMNFYNRKDSFNTLLDVRKYIDNETNKLKKPLPLKDEDHLNLDYPLIYSDPEARSWLINFSVIAIICWVIIGLCITY